MNYKLLFLLCSLAGIMAACSPSDVDPQAGDETILVRVDGEPITLSMLELMMENRGIDEDDHERMQELLDELIRMRAVANAAIEENLTEQPAVRAERELRDMQTLYRHYINQFHREQPVTDAEIEEIYQTQHERAGETQYRIETIAYPEQAEALRTIAALDDGRRDYEDVRRQAQEAGQSVEEPGWIDLSQVPPEFGSSLRGSEPGDVVSSPLQTPQGWRLVRVVETRALEVPDLDEVREGIARSLLQRRRQALIDELYERAEIEPMLPLEED